MRDWINDFIKVSPAVAHRYKKCHNKISQVTAILREPPILNCYPRFVGSIRGIEMFRPVAHRYKKRHTKFLKVTAILREPQYSTAIPVSWDQNVYVVLVISKSSTVSNRITF